MEPGLLCVAHGDRGFRVQGRHQSSSNRGKRYSGVQPQEQPLKPGEFLLGYENERHEVSSMPRPEVLGKNGTYVVFRKLHQRVAAFRQYLKENSSTPEEEALLGAKIDGALAERRAVGVVSHAR